MTVPTWGVAPIRCPSSPPPTGDIYGLHVHGLPTSDRAASQIGLHAIGNIDRTIYHGAYPDGTAIRFESFTLWGR